MSRLPIGRPLSVAKSLTQTDFVDVDINLYDLYTAHQKHGAVVGRTFTGCRLQGPAIVLIGGGTTFDDTNFGDSRGGMKNLLLQPMGDKALGTVPMHGCTFVGCEFYNVGFTGSAEVLALLVEVPTVSADTTGTEA